MKTFTYTQTVVEVSDIIRQMEDHAHALRTHVQLMLDDKSSNTCPVNRITDVVKRFGGDVCQSPEEVLPLFFAATFYNALLHLRLQYEDVRELADRYLGEEQGQLAADLVFALTPSKGKCHKERYSRDFYNQLRQVPYGPFLMLCIRVGQIRYLIDDCGREGQGELQFFDMEAPYLQKALIVSPVTDMRQTLPEALIEEMYALLSRAPIMNS